jgi:hypothetical protein
MKSKEIESKYYFMDELCKRAISQAEEILFSEKEFNIPKELYE